MMAALRRTATLLAGVAVALGVFVGHVPVAAAAVYPGARAPAAAIEQRLGALLPLDAAFVDSAGRAVRLGDYFRATPARAAVPVVLVLGYYHCPNLCETVMEGTLQALAESGLSRRSFRVLAVSIDPDETPADARSRRAIDLQVADAAWRANPDAAAGDPLTLDALVGSAASIAALARQAGFVFSRSADSSDDRSRSAFAHAAGFLIATPDGRVSRYFLGVRHDPADLRSAVDAAAGRSIGGLVDDLLLLCAHLDPTLGRFTASVMLGLRVGCLALVALLGLWIWRHRRASPPRASS